MASTQPQMETTDITRDPVHVFLATDVSNFQFFVDYFICVNFHSVFCILFSESRISQLSCVYVQRINKHPTHSLLSHVLQQRTIKSQCLKVPICPHLSSPSHSHSIADHLTFTQQKLPKHQLNSRQPNPKHPNLPSEPAGPIASDSLAAESLSSGGAFANNENVHRMDVTGSSTLNNADTSNATELPPAPDAARRDGNDKAKYPEGAGKPSFPGMHDEHGYVGGPSQD